MSRSVTSRAASSVVAILALILAVVLPPEPARSQQEITPVEVVNTPLPVKALDPLPVDISEVPTVDLAGTPSVQVAPLEPFQISRSSFLLPGETETTDRFTVPQGDLLVIEYFTAFAELARGQRAHFSLSVQTNGSYATHQMVAVAHGRFEEESIVSDVFASSELTRFYADPGSEVLFTATRSTTLPSSFSPLRFTISGYLVDV